jgi:hypothetical protein
LYRRDQRRSALNVGWLDGVHAFPQEQPSEPLLDALWTFVCSPVNQARGLHECELCPRDADYSDRVREVQRRMRDPEDPFHATPLDKLPWRVDARHRSNTAQHNGEQRLIGSAEIRVFGKEGAIYAAPTLIYHYVEQHHYKPPADFVHALLDGPQPSSGAYAALMRRYEIEGSELTRWRNGQARWPSLFYRHQAAGRATNPRRRR